VTWLQSELAEVAEELFLATAAADTLRSCSNSSAARTLASPCSLKLAAEVGDVLFNAILAAELCHRDGLGCSLDTACRAAAAKVRRRASYAFQGGGGSAATDVRAAEDCWQQAKAAELSPQGQRPGQAASLAAAPSAPASPVAAPESGSGAAIEAASGGAAACAAYGDAAVLFAKWPLIGCAKTRLAKAAELGDGGAQLVGGETPDWELATPLSAHGRRGVRLNLTPPMGLSAFDPPPPSAPAARTLLLSLFVPQVAQAMLEDASAAPAGWLFWDLMAHQLFDEEDSTSPPRWL
jgi:NTP pyrophosphatase (non-canonical NTP hydrolase)